MIDSIRGNRCGKTKAMDYQIVYNPIFYIGFRNSFTLRNNEYTWLVWRDYNIHSN